MKISLLRPTLDAHGVNMVAVGVEQLGAEEFVEREFFKGGGSEVGMEEGGVLEKVGVGGGGGRRGVGGH